MFFCALLGVHIVSQHFQTVVAGGWWLVAGGW
jgi:hypothetical protein